MQRRLSPEQQAGLVADHQADHSQRHLANRYGVHVSTVQAILTRTDTERRTPGPDPDRAALICRLYENQQLSCARIAERLGCDPTTIWNILRRQGVRLRDTTGRA
jgi:transposase